MTYEEAIAYAKNTCYCAGCPIDMSSIGDEDPCSSCKHRGFFELVIEILEKQVPKKPIETKSRIYHEHGDSVTVELKTKHLCPSCKAYVFESINGGNKFCNRCGQAIDWSEE